MSSHSQDQYFVPDSSVYPFAASIALFFIAMGGASFLNGYAFGPKMMTVGFIGMACLLFIWFRKVIIESPDYNMDVDKSFRIGMAWFIFSEVMFFAAFFGALYYLRTLAIPWLAETELLWPGFEASWPSTGPMGAALLTGAGATPDATAIAEGTEFAIIDPWHLPLLNTLLLLASSVTLTIAHHALRANKRGQLIFWLGLTVFLGALFLFYQAEEYIEAYQHLGLTLGTGVYGSTFFLLTGFHGFHVCLGAFILFVVLIRCIKGHFTAERHFVFEAGAWYWHFVDTVWVGLFIFVYIL
ncbi:cytochrome c oxidase subunit 3 [Arenicella xantha]|uniref:cytochrome-c oxidase n=1 Tax=Arenicella xantha TaxID=644221 RepID=A0A395JRX0_9GAMM|nr:cytochrome c oxidase subunit 3 [Arenicella xantha]RBP53082.1 cytochrome c oxidase subunit 3 [Arenicella xantha]